MVSFVVTCESRVLVGVPRLFAPWAMVFLLVYQCVQLLLDIRSAFCAFWNRKTVFSKLQCIPAFQMPTIV